MPRRTELIIERRYADPADPDYERDQEIVAEALLKVVLRKGSDIMAKISANGAKKEVTKRHDLPISITDEGYLDCVEDRCAWWDPTEKTCAILLLAQSLDSIDYILKSGV